MTKRTIVAGIIIVTLVLLLAPTPAKALPGCTKCYYNQVQRECDGVLEWFERDFCWDSLGTGTKCQMTYFNSCCGITEYVCFEYPWEDCLPW